MAKQDQSPAYSLFTESDRDQFLVRRPGEQHLGEAMPLLTEWGRVGDLPEVKFVILGIPEGFGPMVNRGRSGARQGWTAFLTKFLNMQSNRFLSGKQVAIAGQVLTHDLPDVQESTDPLAEAPRYMEQLDARVAQAVADLQLPKGVTLIVIGGGHNNAYPIIKGLGTGASVVNVDPHADFRAMEGRHSGNPFRYAIDAGLMEVYLPVALHRMYNNEESIAAMEAHERVHPLWWDDIQIPQEIFFWVTQRLHGRMGSYLGLEMDMDGLANMPASAYSPEGFTPREARAWVRRWAQTFPNTRYFHLPEAAPSTPREVDFAGKMLAYLVSDFIMAAYGTA